MRILEVARALRQGVDPCGVAPKFLDLLRSPVPPPLDDVAAITQRLARHARPPASDVFSAVANHLESTVRLNSTSVNGPAISVLADAFAHSRQVDAVSALGVACVSADPNMAMPPADLMTFVRACILLDAQSDPAIRSFIRMRYELITENMQACDLAESGRLLAHARIFSDALSRAISLHLSVNPWDFGQRDCIALMPHFQMWRLGELQKKAFQRLAIRLGEVAEGLVPEEALQVINVYAAVGSVNEILMQNMHLRLLIDRCFVELSPQGIAQLTASMAKIQYFHTGLLREIVAHIGENHRIIAKWSPGELLGALKSFGLAPINVPTPTLRMLGCRYNSLLWDQTQSCSPRFFFEVAANYPELIQVVLERGGAKKLTASFISSSAEWGPRAFSDAMLGIASALDLPSYSKSGAYGYGCGCNASTAGYPLLADQKRFRIEQPEAHMRVVHRASRNFRQRDRQGRSGFTQRGVHPDLPPTGSKLKGLWWPEDQAPAALIGSGRCSADWVLPGRKIRHIPATNVTILLDAVIPRLLATLAEKSRDLGELPGAVSPVALLEGNPQDEMPVFPKPADIDAAFLTAGDGQIQSSDLLAPGNTHGFEGKPSNAERPHGGHVESQAHFPEGNSLDTAESPVMRRSELIQVCVQTLAAFQLVLSPRANGPPPALSLELCRKMSRLVPLLNFVLRPRRETDEAVQKYHLGPQRLEAFVRRPDDDSVLQVYKTLTGMMPYLPRILDWAEWDSREDDVLQGEVVGGRILSLRRDVEVPPFVISVLLKPKSTAPAQTWSDNEEGEELQ